MTSPADLALLEGFDSLREAAGFHAHHEQASGLRKSLFVIFQEPADITTEGEQTVLTNPEAHLPTSEAENVAKGDTLEISGTTYKVASIRHDSIGITRLILTEQ